MGKDMPIFIVEITEVFKKLLGGKALGVDEVCPKMLKALYIVGLPWLTRLFSVTWRSGVAERVHGYYFQKGGTGESNYGVSHC